MQEESDQMILQELQAQQNLEDSKLPMTNYEKSKLKTLENRQLYGDDASKWPDGVRPADQNQFTSLYDDMNDGANMMDHQDYEGNVFN